MNWLRKKATTCVPISSIAFLVGCATMTPEQRAVLGGTIGAVTGAVIGSALGGKGKKTEAAAIGATIGAGVGALAGYWTSKWQEAKPVSSPTQTEQRYGYRREEGPKVHVEEMRLDPDQIKSGDRYTAEIRLAALNTQYEQPVTIALSVWRDGRMLKQYDSTTQAIAGTYTYHVELGTPQALEAGTYEVRATVQYGSDLKEVSQQLKVA